jgi:hypothetical protein
MGRLDTIEDCIDPAMCQFYGECVRENPDLAEDHPDIDQEQYGQH